MSEFVARVGTPDGLVKEERHHALSLEALRRELEGKGLFVFSVRPARRWLRAPLLQRRERLSSLDFLVFNQQLATLLGAGIPVLQSLELLQRSQSKPFLRQVLARVLDEVKSGAALSEAFARQDDLFPRLYSATLLSGERSGELVSVLERYIKHQQLMDEVRRRVSTALTYPAVLVSLAFGLVVLLVTYVIPRFADFFIGFASELPLPTQIVIETSQWVQHNIVPLGAGLVIGLLVLRRWLATDGGRLARDRFILRLPFVGVVFHLLSLSQFVRALATLLAGGTPLVTALEVASSTVTNRHHLVSLSRVALRVREGQALWSSLERTGLFSELSIAMVQVGEATGALEGMLFNASKFYDETIEIRLARVVTLIEPAVLVLMGGVIAALLLSVYMPMFSLLQRGQ